MNDGDLLASVLERVVKGKLDEFARSFARVDAGRNGDGVRVITNRDVVFKGDVKTPEVLSHEYNVDIVESSLGTGRTLA